MPHGTDRLSASLRCARHRWPEVHTILRREKQPHTAFSTEDGRWVILHTTPRAATALRDICEPITKPPTWTPTKPAAPAPDALDVAFARAAAEARQGRKPGARRA